MLLVLVDTSSILYGLENSKDVFEIAKSRFPGCNILVSKGVVAELSGLSSSASKTAQLAKTALQIIKLKKVRVDNITGSADNWIFNKAIAEPSIAITNDTALYKRLKSRKLSAFKLSKKGILK